MLPILLALFGATVLAWWLFQVRFDPDELLPPGPKFRLPVIGQAFHLGKNPIQGLRKLRKQYGDILTLQVGPFHGIYVSSLDMIEELMNREEYSGRIDPNYAFKEDINSQIRGSNPCPGLMSSSGDLWREQRRFTLRHLRDFGFGKASLETVILEEFQDLANHLRKRYDQGAEETEVNFLFNSMTISVLWRIVTGKGIDREDKEQKGVFQKLQHILLNFGVNNVLLLLGLMYIPGRFRSYDPFIGKMSNLMHELFAEFDKEKEEHEETYDEDEMRDFTDVYIRECRRATKDNDTESSFYGEQGRSNFRNVLFDLFLAGSETTSTSLEATVLYCLHHPRIADRVRAEIDQVVGRERLPQAADREKMPYTEAFMSEVQRFAAIGFLAAPHAADHDTVFRGFKIKKNTPININLFEVMRDPNNFAHPDKFDPERFLTPSGEYHAPRAYVPFGLGRRQCLGKSLAKMELFFFTTALLQQFNFEPASSGLPGMDDVNVGLVRAPKAFSAKFVPREE